MWEISTVTSDGTILWLSWDKLWYWALFEPEKQLFLSRKEALEVKHFICDAAHRPMEIKYVDDR